MQKNAISPLTSAVILIGACAVPASTAHANPHDPLSASLQGQPEGRSESPSAMSDPLGWLADFLTESLADLFGSAEGANPGDEAHRDDAPGPITVRPDSDTERLRARLLDVVHVEREDEGLRALDADACLGDQAAMLSAARMAAASDLLQPTLGDVLSTCPDVWTWYSVPCIKMAQR